MELIARRVHGCLLGQSRLALALTAILLLVTGCSYGASPEVEAAIHRSRCNTLVFGGLLEYFAVQALCAADRPSETEESKSQDLCRKATSGDSWARLELAWFYRNGLPPVKADSIEAYKWFALAADVGSTKAARYRDKLGAELTPSQLNSAQSRHAAWSPDIETCQLEQGQWPLPTR